MSTETDMLLIDDIDNPYYTNKNNFSALKELQLKFINSYVENKDKVDVDKWLFNELKKNLPEKNEEEIGQITREIIRTLKVNQEKHESLKSAVQQGRSKEHWFASEMKQATSNLSSAEASKYLSDLDTAVINANEEMARTILTKSGAVSQNPNLDGYIAEQFHANTFNMNAQSTGSQYRAEVLLPKDGQTYAKNSVDIVIKDSNGKIVRRYQSKYCSDSEATKNAFESGDYRGQRKLVSEGQAQDLKNAYEFIEAPDGTKSTALSKQKAKALQEDAQSGKSIGHDWNEYQFKNVALGIGKQAGYAALQGAAIGAGIEIATKLCAGEEIRGEEVLETALISGADFGIKAATAGAIKVGVEKGVISMIPKGTPAGTIANIACVAIENVKVLGKVASGELTVSEGLDQMEVTTVSTVAGMAASVEGAALGAAVGTVFGPVGTVVGGFVGGVVGYAAGSKVAEKVVKGVQKVRAVAKEIVKETWTAAKSVASSAWEGAKSFACSLFSR